MSLDELVKDMTEAAANNPGINLILYREAVNTTISVVGTLVGIATVILSALVFLVLAVELTVLNIPTLSYMLLDRESYTEDAGVEKKHRNWGLFLNDARKALRIHAEEGKSINLCYLKVKWVTMLCLSSAISLLFSGQDTIVALVTRMLGPILARIASA